MTRSKIILALPALLLLAALVFFGKLVLAERPELLVCDLWPPYSVKTEDGLSGMSVEVVRAVYTRMGMKDVKILPLPWKRALEMARFGDADGLFTANHTPERTVYFNYPEEPLLESPWLVWTRQGTTIRTLDDLKGKRIGVVLGYSYTQEFWTFIQTYCSVEEVYNDNINFRKLALGRLDATVADLGNGLVLADTVGGEIHPNLDYEIKRDGLYIVFNKKRVSEKFVQRFSDELSEFKETKAYKAIWDKYMTPAPEN
ncbi:transporter substrate-binding domain-containing protein [uncultured Pseudodesulfovibrio sp.]|uniref:substrate-binding periplasmic protein n=1 Tax=uncultured Pseudodesulfovibrio sp. TaxID=2035858 RepID=UPI0029C6C404|nr:transporter substrate-binding domain-containing protein [uncultured Pseudodesulfovibrio sp.]